MSLSLILAAQAAATPVAAPYPAAAVLEAFGAACKNIASVEQVEKDLQDQSWVAEIPPEDSPLGRLLAVGRQAGEKLLDGPDDRMSDTRVFTKTIAGERLDIILSRVESGDTFVNGCRLYDVEETRPITAADGQKWIDREPTRSLERDEITVTNWTPGYAAGHDSFEIFYVPAESPIIALTQFNGLALKADFVGEMEQ